MHTVFDVSYFMYTSVKRVDYQTFTNTVFAVCVCECLIRHVRVNPLTAGVAYIRVFIFY